MFFLSYEKCFVIVFSWFIKILLLTYCQLSFCSKISLSFIWFSWTFKKDSYYLFELETEIFHLSVIPWMTAAAVVRPAWNWEPGTPSRYHESGQGLCTWGYWMCFLRHSHREMESIEIARTWTNAHIWGRVWQMGGYYHSSGPHSLAFNIVLSGNLCN